MCRILYFFLVPLCFFATLLPGPVYEAAAAQGTTQPADVPPRYKLGKVDVIPLCDSTRSMNMSVFKDADQEQLKRLVPESSAPSAINAFLVVSNTGVVLVDTGMGSNNPERPSLLLENMQKAGVTPESVTMILLTHLHGDHVGGLAWEGKEVFPNATVWLSQMEKDYWFSDEAMAQRPERKANFELARQRLGLYGDRVKTFAFGDTVFEGMTALGAKGHTPGHTVFLLESGTKRLLFWGDLVHAAAVQIPRPEICASYDMDLSQATASRLSYLDLAEKQKMPVAGAHLPYPGIGKITKNKDQLSGVYSYKPGL